VVVAIYMQVPKCSPLGGHGPAFVFSRQKIAIAAEVEENTLANAAPLSRRALRDILA
jgi:hypothetical protein